MKIAVVFMQKQIITILLARVAVNELTAIGKGCLAVSFAIYLYDASHF